jgi:hypothetical protein
MDKLFLKFNTNLYLKNKLTNFKSYLNSVHLKYFKIRKNLKLIKRIKKINFVKFLPIGLYLTVIFLETQKKNMFCFKASNKELEKMTSNIENQIKNLEFKYHGKLRRQPIKYYFSNLVMV